MTRCIHCWVSGRVQGVFFRAATRDKALALGLTGWVRNAADGRVEVVACGDEANVAALRHWLGRGPGPAQVDDVTCGRIADQGFDGFEIRYKR